MYVFPSNSRNFSVEPVAAEAIEDLLATRISFQWPQDLNHLCRFCTGDSALLPVFGLNCESDVPSLMS
jgi:hypothetical protein